MGRSVMTLGGDALVAYQTLELTHYCEECEEYCEEHQEDLFCEPGCDHSPEWDDFIDSVQTRATELWPSMEEDSRWIDQEIRVVASNSHSVVTVSEYGGMIAICLGANYDRGGYWMDPDAQNRARGEHWREQVAGTFVDSFGEYRKVGTFSNGESVFERA